MFKKYLFCFVALIFALAGCSDSKRPILNSDATVLAFGDSLTFGIGAKNETYPDALSNISGFTVINAGISGETTSQGLERYQSLLDKHSPELVVLLEGGNDILRNHSSSLTKSNLAEMIKMTQRDNISLILIGVPEKKLFSDSAPLFYELAEEYDLIFSDDLLADLLRTPKYKSDPIHLNSAGYRKLAEGIYELLVDNHTLN